jgi:hypothetical protein
VALLGYVYPCHKPQSHPAHNQQTSAGLALFHDVLGIDYIVFSDETAHVECNGTVDDIH